MTWNCPRCGRAFARAGQWHSCAIVDVDRHFAGRPAELRDAYQAILGGLADDVRVASVKTAIHVAAKSVFASITVRRDHLRVGFLLDRALDSQRVTRTERLSRRVVANGVDVHHPYDVDDELLGWLAEAYARVA